MGQVSKILTTDGLGHGPAAIRDGGREENGNYPGHPSGWRLPTPRGRPRQTFGGCRHGRGSGNRHGRGSHLAATTRHAARLIVRVLGKTGGWLAGGGCCCCG